MDSQNNQSGGNSAGQNSSMPNMSAKDTNMILAVFSYLGPLVIISYILGKDDFTKFHARQGAIVFGLEVLVWILGTMMYSLWMILNLVNLATLIFSILGVINVIQGKKKELPIIGGLAQSFGL